ncbi:MAG: ATP-binding cassette domain-containing protein [Elusimicrobiales bacterium]|nr:ATP-binding cassette domain-containing protein [Elusimicrobiales bacterium]NLH39363.1 ATP-binding cassette domain-containing protein [Elusimicrobiota bacterium]
MNAINIKDITKKFKEVDALSGISFDIKQGEVFSLLGPNGAGKTTLISILTTILKPTSGTAVINGKDIIKEPLDVRKNIGIVFQEPSLDDLLTAKENLYLHSMLYNMPKEIAKKRIKDILITVNLYERKDHIVKTFSGGMKRQLEIARGLLHTPKILFLDEPTVGLDPFSRRNIWEYIKKVKKEQNITIILTTHYMEEAESLSDRIAIINKGKIIELDTPENLKKKIGDEILIIKGIVDDNRVRSLDFIKSVDLKNDKYIITSKEITKNLNKILEYVKRIDDIEIRKTSLEDVFLKMTGKKIEELDE